MSAPGEKYSAVRPQGREHFPVFPKGFIAIRIVQLVLCLIILALSGYGIGVGYAANGIVFIMVVAIMTLITSIYHIVAETGAPNIFNYWAVLSLDIFMIIMWLASFALLASAVAIWASVTNSGYYIGYTYYYTYGYSKAWVGSLAGAAAIGAMEFVLHIISLVIVSVMIHRHRSAGLHSMPGAARTMPGQASSTAPAAVTGPASAPMTMGPNGEKLQPAQQVYAQQQQQQQPVPQNYPVQHHSQPPMYPQQQNMTPPPGQNQPYYPQQVPQQLPTQHTGGSYVQQPSPVHTPHQQMPPHSHPQGYQTVQYQTPPPQ